MKNINALTDNLNWFDVPVGPTGVRPDNPIAGQLRYMATE
jgi:hypothetical protein